MAAVVTNPPPFGRGKSRGRGYRNKTPTQPGHPTETVGECSVISDSVVDISAPECSSIESLSSPKKEAKVISANINDIMKRMDNLTSSEILKTVVPDIMLITEKTAIEELVHALSVKAISDPQFGETAVKILCEIWNNKSSHYLIRTPLLKQTQEDYKQRDETGKQNQSYGLLLYMCELFKHLRVMDKPLHFMGDAVIQLLKDLIQKKEKQSDDDIFYFHQQLESVGFLLGECLPEKTKEIINMIRRMVISSTLMSSSIRCRLLQLIELHASKWKMTDGLKVKYNNCLEHDVVNAIEISQNDYSGSSSAKSSKSDLTESETVDTSQSDNNSSVNHEDLQDTSVNGDDLKNPETLDSSEVTINYDTNIVHHYCDVRTAGEENLPVDKKPLQCQSVEQVSKDLKTTNLTAEKLIISSEDSAPTHLNFNSNTESLLPRNTLSAVGGDYYMNRIGTPCRLRLGLSRKTRVGKPLHPNVMIP